MYVSGLVVLFSVVTVVVSSPSKGCGCYENPEFSRWIKQSHGGGEFVCDEGYRMIVSTICEHGKWEEIGKCVSVDSCQSNPCKNNGTCINGKNGYTCKCLAGVGGENCRGTCPTVPVPKPECLGQQNDCRVDDDCPERKRCCETGCGKACVEHHWG